MMYLLDTNVISELRKGKAADRKVQRWESKVTADELFVSAITMLELEVGVLSIEHRDSLQGAALRRWFDSRVLKAFEGRVLPVDLEVALRSARLNVPDKRPRNDSLIAATALVHRMTLVTRNTGDFEGMGVGLVNPWVD